MRKGSLSQIMEKLEHLEEMSHSIKTDVEVTKEQLKQINGRINKHDEIIQESRDFISGLKGKTAIVAGAIGMLASIITAWITNILIKN